jgi:predicted nucleic acid-binding Zn ribbon protein
MKVLYEFYCTECGNTTDKFLEYKNIPKYLEDTTCEKCGAAIKKTPAFGAAHFKGQGFTKKTT